MIADARNGLKHTIGMPQARTRLHLGQFRRHQRFKRHLHQDIRSQKAELL